MGSFRKSIGKYRKIKMIKIVNKINTKGRFYKKNNRTISNDFGNYKYMSKSEADDTKKIATSFLKKHDYFTGWRSGTITWTRSGMWGENKSSVGVEVSTMNEDDYLRIHYTQTDNNTGKKRTLIIKYHSPLLLADMEAKDIGSSARGIKIKYIVAKE
jgi:hypothetical protein